MVEPPSSRRSLFFPMRLEVPAARITPATRSAFMDASALRPQMHGLAPGAHRQHLGDDADRHLLRSFGAQVEPYRREDLLRIGGAELPQDLLLARARAEKTQVGERLRQERAQPVAVVDERVRLHDGEVAWPQPGDAFR